MKILAIISYYKHRDYIAQAIKSLRDQNMPVDILLINDEPGDALNFLHQDYDFHFLDDQQNKGQAARFNEGIKYAAEHGYDWIMFQGADDYSVPFRSLMLHKVIVTFPEIDLLYTDFISILKEKEFVFQNSRPFQKEALAFFNFICASTVCVRTAVAMKAAFNEQIGYGEDWLWYHKLIHVNATITYLPMPTVYYREYSSVVGEKTEDRRLQVRKLIWEMYDEASINNWSQRLRSQPASKNLN